MAIVEGKKAPAFTLPDQDGKNVSLADFVGKNVVVYFYPKDDTPGCTKEACGFRDDWKTLQKLGVVVLGVSADDAASHTKFRTKYKLPFTLLSDPSRKTMTAYGAYGEKMMYGKKVTGVSGRPSGSPRRHREEALGPRAEGRRAPDEGARGAAGRLSGQPPTVDAAAACLMAVASIRITNPALTDFRAAVRIAFTYASWVG
jgi:peroxiredoxin Q/BCP